MATIASQTVKSSYQRMLFRDSTDPSSGSGCKIQFTNNAKTADITSNLFLATDAIGVGTSAPASVFEIKDGSTTGGAVLTLGTNEASIVANDVLGRINFYAPAENTGGTTGDQRLPGASIAATAPVGSLSATTLKGIPAISNLPHRVS